jgi:hypothetical protein
MKDAGYQYVVIDDCWQTSGEVHSRASSSRASSSCLRLAKALRQNRSMARRLAVAVSHGSRPLFRGGEESFLREVLGEVDVAGEPAMTRADSMRQTASMVRV